MGEDQLNKVNALLEARDGGDASPTTSKAKPKLSKARTMQNTAKVGRVEKKEYSRLISI